MFFDNIHDFLISSFLFVATCVISAFVRLYLMANVKPKTIFIFTGITIFIGELFIAYLMFF